MRTLLPLGALLALSIAGCSDAANTLAGPDENKPLFSCAGASGNCGNNSGGGGQHNNNPNNPPSTAP
jgi:hypothetical protein